MEQPEFDPSPPQAMLGICTTEPELGMQAEGPLSTPLVLLRLLHILTLNLGGGDVKSLGFNLNLPPPQGSHMDITGNLLSLLSVGHT